jgi:hypothetical protein
LPGSDLFPPLFRRDSGLSLGQNIVEIGKPRDRAPLEF